MNSEKIWRHLFGPLSWEIKSRLKRERAGKIKTEPGTRIASRLSLVEQKTGIEPAFLAWEANVLPLNYFCI